MTKSRMILILASVLSTASACSFDGALHDQFHRPTDQTVGEIPLKIGLIVDENEQVKSIHNSLDAVIRYNVKVQPGLANAVAAELATIFREVVMVKNAKQAGDVNLLAYVSFQVTETRVDNFFCRLELRFYDPQTRQIVTSFQRSENVEVGASGGLVTGALLTAATLGLGAPVFMQMGANSQGERVVEVFEAKLPGMVRGVTGEIRSEQRMLASASGMRPGQPDVAFAQKAPVVTSDVDRVPTLKTATKKNAYAVVIGIEQYRQKLPPADFAAHDAKIIGEYLTKVLGYQEENVVVRLNDKAAKTDLEKYLEEWLSNKVGPDDSVFVYYSGHGAPNPKSGEPYLVPYDGDPAFVESTTYPLKRLYAAMDKLPAKAVVIMLDSCFSGAGGRSVIAKGMRPMGLSIENPVLASGKTVVLAASSGTQVSSTFLEQGHGLLTYFFLKGLQGEGDINKDGTIEMPELYEYVRPNVERVARNQYNNEQTPQLLARPDVLKRGGGRLLERVRP
jgi:hypothetical protein